MTSDAESHSRVPSNQACIPERQGARRLLSPFKCRVWAQHSRPEEQLSDEACKSLRESIAKNGQHQPALGRPVSDDPACEIEIICGARRHSVARALGRELLVEVRHMTDADAYVAMYDENLLREEDSPYVRGQILWRALRSGTYSSQEELGRAFNLSHSAVSRLVMLAQLPAIVVGAFHSPDEIREAWGVELFRLCNDDVQRRDITVRARAIEKKAARPPPRQIYETLVTPSGGRPKEARPYRSVPIRGASGAILFREQERLASITYAIPKTLLSPDRRTELQQMLARFLDNAPLNLDSQTAHAAKVRNRQPPQSRPLLRKA